MWILRKLYKVLRAGNAWGNAIGDAGERRFVNALRELRNYEDILGESIQKPVEFFVLRGFLRSETGQCEYAILDAQEALDRLITGTRYSHNEKNYLRAYIYEWYITCLKYLGKVQDSIKLEKERDDLRFDAQKIRVALRLNYPLPRHPDWQPPSKLQANIRGVSK